MATEAIDRGVDAGARIDVAGIRPKSCGDLLSGNKLTIPLQKQGQQT